MQKQHLDLTNDYNFLKEGYNNLINENSELRTDLIKKNKMTKNLVDENIEISALIKKLFEVRGILNKYFESYFGNFKYIIELKKVNTKLNY